MKPRLYEQELQRPSIRALSDALGARAEEVCQRYLPNGHREGRYWLVGDINGNAGRSLYVRLSGPGSYRPGWWADTATSETGDLFDLIRHHEGGNLKRTFETVRGILALPPVPVATPVKDKRANRDDPTDRSDAVRRLWALCGPLAGSHAETYLASRGITAHALHGAEKSLRAHPELWHRDKDTKTTLPGLVASVRDTTGRLRGLHRTFLHPERPEKAHLESPRRAMGAVQGHGVWFGAPIPEGQLIVGEGIETVLSLRMAFPDIPAVAALSAAGLAALHLPDQPVQFLIAADKDRAGLGAARTLANRVRDAGGTVKTLLPEGGDFNDDLQIKGVETIARRVRRQM